MKPSKTMCILGMAVLVSLFLAQFLLSNSTQTLRLPPVASYIQRINYLAPTCTNVSHEMTRGHWLLTGYTPGQLADVESYLNYSRTYKKIPLELQRADRKCGKSFYCVILSLNF